MNNEYEVNENDVNFSIDAVEKIKKSRPIIEIQNEIANENNEVNDIVK
ncbi:MAG: hypothetical protein LBL56_03430 [Treponema sp.]|jgi:hypothetical protein|nr:hypothetical protein [Treponema sp.]